MHWHRKEHPSYPKSWQGGWPFPVDYPLEPAPLLAVLSAVCLSLSVTISIYFHCLNSISLFHIKILFSILEKRTIFNYQILRPTIFTYFSYISFFYKIIKLCPYFFRNFFSNSFMNII